MGLKQQIQPVDPNNQFNKMANRFQKKGDLAEVEIAPLVGA